MKTSEYMLYVLMIILTTEVLQDEVQLPSRLEGVDEIDNKGMLHFLQNVPLCLGVSCVFSIAYDHSLNPAAEK